MEPGRRPKVIRVTYGWSAFPSSQRRGGRDMNKISRSHRKRRRRARSASAIARSRNSGQFGVNAGSRRASIEASPFRARASRHPVCAASVASRHSFDGAATPPLRGGECAPPIPHHEFRVIALAIVFLLLLGGGHTSAHKPVTSKYDYNRDGFPLLREHCGRCHVKGGPGPMSLMTYADAVPWAVSVRDELSAGRMPPWPVDPTSPAVKGAHPINSRDMNTILVWASGGTPEGNTEAKLPAVTFNPQWKLGPPDLAIPMDAEYAVAPGKIEETYETSLPVNVT